MAWTAVRYFILSIIYLCGTSECKRMFLNGRRYGGFLKPPEVAPGTPLPPDEWLQQQLDHFDPTNARTWKQRYFTNNSFHIPGGPAFLFIGGEGPASSQWMVEGQWINYAKKYNALCFQLEHRYYGLSHPTSDLRPVSLKYLSSQQALADLAFFIEAMTMKYELPPNIKWIVFGGSYPGSLAVWLRTKYPHLVHAAVSSSAPLTAKADFREYLRVVKDDLKQTSSLCVSPIEEANKELHMLLKHPIGQETVHEIFKLCYSIDVLEKNDISNLYEILASQLAGIAQYDKIDHNISLDTVCNVMSNDSVGTPVHRYATLSNIMLELDGETCLDHKYEEYIEDMGQESWQSIAAEGGARQWLYQTCTEFGFYVTPSLTTDMFGNEFSLEFYVQQCIDIFGPRFNKEQLMRGIKRTNTMYGSLNQQASRIVHVQGSFDPWHALGITRTIHQDSPAIFIRGTSHCADMLSPSPSDPPQLQIARKMIDDLIGTWLDED